MTPEGQITDLLPCPFCGSGAELHQVPFEPETDNAGGYFIECENRGCSATTSLHFSCGDDCRPELREKWNRRAAIAGPGAREPVAWRLEPHERTPSTTVHILRNPWNWHEDDVRAARLSGADAIEANERRREAFDRKSRDEVWYWQGDGTDEPATLTCPVLIEAYDLVEILRAAPPADEARDAARYRWLRLNRSDGCYDEHGALLDAEELDAAIDAAIAGKDTANG